MTNCTPPRPQSVVQGEVAWWESSCLFRQGNFLFYPSCGGCMRSLFLSGIHLCLFCTFRKTQRMRFHNLLGCSSCIPWDTHPWPNRWSSQVCGWTSTLTMQPYLPTYIFTCAASADIYDGLGARCWERYFWTFHRSRWATHSPRAMRGSGSVHEAEVKCKQFPWRINLHHIT